MPGIRKNELRHPTEWSSHLSHSVFSVFAWGNALRDKSYYFQKMGDWRKQFVISQAENNYFGYILPVDGSNLKSEVIKTTRLVKIKNRHGLNEWNNHVNFFFHFGYSVTFIKSVKIGDQSSKRWLRPWMFRLKKNKVIGIAGWKGT